MVEIVPSLLGAYDKIKSSGKMVELKLPEEIDRAIAAGVERLEVDLMRRKFVPNTRNLPLGLIFKAVKERVKLDIHFMGYINEQAIDNLMNINGVPDRKIDTFSFHYEATPDPRRIAMYIKEKGMKASVALNPWTPVSSLEDALEEKLVDEVLVMSVCPGKGRQKFREETYRKLERLKKMTGPNIRIKVDGGVNEENAQGLYKSGADILVIGSAFFNSGDYKGFVDRIRNKCS